jgi:hypothetical protein
MWLVTCRVPNRQNPAANHLPLEAQQPFANAARITALTTDKAADLIHRYDIVKRKSRALISFYDGDLP